MSWDLKLNAEGEDPELKAITQRSERAREWADNNLSNAALHTVLGKTKLTKEAKRKNLSDNAVYIGIAHDLQALLAAEKLSAKLTPGMTKQQQQAAMLQVLGEWVKNVVENADKIKGM